MNKTKTTLALTLSLAIVSFVALSLSATEKSYIPSEATAIAAELATALPGDFAHHTDPGLDPTNEVRCFHCGSGSKGQCSKGSKCYGERSACTKKGCRISGSVSKCSRAANAPPRC